MFAVIVIAPEKIIKRLNRLRPRHGNKVSCLTIKTPSSDAEVEDVKSSIVHFKAIFKEILFCSDDISTYRSEFMDNNTGRIHIISVVDPDAIAEVLRMEERIDLDGASEILRAFRPLKSGEDRKVNLAAEEAFRSLYLLSRSLRDQIGSAVSQLNAQKPNDPAALENHNSLVDLLDKILNCLNELEAQLHAAIKGNKKAIRLAENNLTTVRVLISKWWSDNSVDAVDWSIRFPVIGGILGMMHLAGAETTIATACTFAAIGGPKIAKIIQKKEF